MFGNIFHHSPSAAGIYRPYQYPYMPIVRGELLLYFLKNEHKHKYPRIEHIRQDRKKQTKPTVSYGHMKRNFKKDTCSRYKKNRNNTELNNGNMRLWDEST